MEDFIIFDDTLARKQKPGSPTIHINFTAGIFTIGRAGMRLMQMETGDRVKIVYRKSTDEWFIWKSCDGGFLLRDKKSKKTGSYGVMFNSAATTEEIANKANYKEKSAILPIGIEPEIDIIPTTDSDEIKYWPIINAKLLIPKK